MDAPAKADRITVEELLRWAREGRLRIPVFQRGMLWEAADKEAFLDSLERGYPVGTLLLWKRPASAIQDLGRPLPGAPEAPDSGDVYLVVDGQQRIATLWESLELRPDPAEKRMLFELPEERFRFRRLTHREQAGEDVARGELSPLPLHEALDAVDLSMWLPPSLSTEMKRRYFEVGKRLREYPLPAYIMEGDDIEVLQEVFRRINSAGRPLKREDVFDGLVGHQVARGDRRGLGIVAEGIRATGFGALKPATILNAFEAVRGDTVGKSDPGTITAIDAERDIGRTEAALVRAARFLITIGIPHANIVPYQLPLVVLARYFALFPEPSERNLDLLRRWFWRASLNELLGGASSSLQQHVSDVLEGEEDRSAQNLLARTGAATRAEPLGIGKTKFTASSALGKLSLAAMIAQRPRDLETGEILTARQLFDDGLDQALRSIVIIRRSDDTVFGSSLANRLLYPKSPGPIARTILRCTDEAALLSHEITRSARDALARGDVETFLLDRAWRLSTSHAAFFDRQAEWDRVDAPSAVSVARHGLGR